MSGQAKSVPCLLLPFWVVWRLVARVLGIVGRLAAAFIGIALMIVGLVLTATIIGAVVGIPLVLFGLLLVVRSLF